MIQNICCRDSKERSQWNGSFEHPKLMFKLMDEKIITILCPQKFAYLDLFYEWNKYEYNFYPASI